jgi:poly(3-hydroxybutyrate) depolymerase
MQILANILESWAPHVPAISELAQMLWAKPSDKVPAAKAAASETLAAGEAPGPATQKFAPGTTTEVPIKVDGQDRSFAVHMPKGWDGKSKLPVLYYLNGLHPGSNEPESFTGLSDRADKGNFIVAYLRGTGRGNTYNNGQSIWGDSANESDYLNQIHNKLSKDLPIDQTREGLAGFSQGGSESYDLAAKNKWISSVQSVEGYMTGREQPIDRPIAEQSIHAFHDAIVPYGGTPQVDKIADREAEQDLELNKYSPEPIIDLKLMFHALEGWMEHGSNYIEPQQHIVDAYNKANGITTPSQITRSGEVTTYSYHSARYGTDVSQVALGQGTHAWAGSTDHSGDIHFLDLGVPFEGYSASDSIAKFFLNHPLVKE